MQLAKIKDSLTNIIKDDFGTWDYNQGIKRAKESGIDNIEFNIKATYVSDPRCSMYEMIDPRTYLLTNVDVLYYARKDKETLFRFKDSFASHKKNWVNCMVPATDKSWKDWPKDEPTGKEAIKKFLKKDFAPRIIAMLDLEGFTSSLRSIKLKRESYRWHMHEIHAKPYSSAYKHL